jgi:hypothetical protein
MEGLGKQTSMHHCHYLSEEPSPNKGVRKLLSKSSGHLHCSAPTRPPAHPSNRLVAQLNETWRVIDDPLQWILQRRKGSPRNKNSGWQGRSFCRTRDALLRCIREYCCLPDQGQPRSICEYRGADGAALQQVLALPEWHADWDRKMASQNLDVRGTDPVQADALSAPLLSQGLEGSEADNQRPIAADPLSIS